MIKSLPMNIRNKLNGFVFRLKQTSRLKLIGFTFLGLIILTLVVEGGYFLSKTILKKRGWESSSILGEELALDTSRNYVKSEGKKRFYDLESSVGTRELPGGKITVGGYVVEVFPGKLIIEVRGKEITMLISGKTDLARVRNEWEEKTYPLLEDLDESFSIDTELKKGDRVDILFQLSEKGIEALSIVKFY